MNVEQVLNAQINDMMKQIRTYPCKCNGKGYVFVIVSGVEGWEPCECGVQQ